MKKVLLLTIALIGTFSIASAQDFDAPMMDLDSQWELTGSYVSVGVADSYGNSGQASAGGLSIAYDFFGGGFKLAPEVDIILGAGGVGFLPGLQIGHDNIYALASYDPDFGLLAGAGGRIDLGDVSAISLGIQGGSAYGIGVGYVTVGYTYKF